MKKVLMMLAMVFGALGANAQLETPVTWKNTLKSLGNGEYELIFTATIKSGWKMYSTKEYKDGPNPTVFSIAKATGVQLVGGIVERTKPTTSYDEMFGTEISYFKNTAVFVQKIKVTGKGKIVVKANVEWMACNSSSCIPPDDKDFEFVIDPAAK